MQGSSADAFWSELRELWEAAGRPPFEALAKNIKVPPAPSPSKSTIGGWLTGTAIPSKGFNKFFAALVAVLQVKAGADVQERSLDSWKELLASAQKERKKSQGAASALTTASVPPPEGPPLIPGDRRVHFFLAGCGVGNSMALLPFPKDSDGGLEEFIDGLRDIGFSEREISPYTQVLNADIENSSREVKAMLVGLYFDTMQKTTGLARKKASSEEFDWFNLGRLLYLVATKTVLSWPEIDETLEVTCASLHYLCETMDISETLRRALKNYATVPPPGRSDGEVYEGANKLARACYSML
ncbi:hypothetical protein ACFYRC_14265 [Streptomyces sp. NPDC005279]|uniref:hypothetical protein n=1 Tax=Streptomyces sp. NPDC005279 TaxID=3364712 RepID=UPI0036B7B3DE